MKKYRQLIVGLCMGLICGGAILAWSAGQGKDMDKVRKEFIENYNHAGMDTTASDALMCRIMVASAGCKRGVEVGSYKGFGAINMGIAFERNGGHLYTLEIDPERVKIVRENLKKVGLDDVVTCIEGDALKTLPELEGEYDYLFLDALKQDYMKYFKTMEPKLKKGSVIIADNVIKSEKAMKDYLDFMLTSPDYESVVIRASMEKQDGMMVSYKIR